MPVRCPDCGELAYRHPCRRRGRFCPLSPPMVFRRSREIRALVDLYGSGSISFAEMQRRAPGIEFSMQTDANPP